VPAPVIWKSTEFPKGCRVCGRNTVLCISRGLCHTCRIKPGILEKARTNTLEREFYTYDDTPSPTDAEVEPDLSDTFGVGEGEGSGLNNRSGERRPGSVTSPVTDSQGPEPSSGPSGLFDKVKKAAKKATDTAKGATVTPPPRKTGEKRPGGGATGKRVSAAESLADIWAAIGGLAERTGKHAPLGRYLAWQAPAAGVMLDTAVEGTPVDKILQPIIRGRGKLDLVVAVVGPPGLILQIERSPHLFTLDPEGHLHHPMLPILKSAIRSSLPTILPAMKKAKANEAKVAEAVREMFPDLPQGADVADEIISEMFAGYFAQVPPTAPYDVPDGATVPA
jgi:hypothetical protein